MTLSGRYWIPGPVEVDPAVAEAMLRPMMGHRGAEAHELVTRLQPGLQAIFGTTRPVMLVTGSATAMIEAAIRSGVRERALCVVSGLFGERMAKIVEQCGKEAIRLHVPTGAVLEPELLDELGSGPEVDAVTLVHSETSTGALAPIEALLARFRRMEDVITIVDGVSSVGGMAIETDRWGADCYLTGSQKALGLPPGLAFGVASERLLDRARDADAPGFYLDIAALHQSAVEGAFPQTPALPIVYALDAQLTRIAAEGLPARFARHRAMRERVEAWVASHGRCGIYAPAGRRADTVTALTLAPERSALVIARDLAARGWQVATGIEADYDRVLRIGHMGDLVPEQLDPLFAILEPLL
ncbi:MAG TPA: aminotransferase class V-fold PLP-dependent enzyme [Gemmatimonadales bacterium]|nr:aminotransferase class V-fold PLP-dependent enzyme [Gemmatimonadales bacterium]